MAFNPVKRVFERVEIASTDVPMTLSGTLSKITLLLATLVVGAASAVYLFLAQSSAITPLLGFSFITAVVLSFVSVIWPRSTRYTALPYALCEGICLGAISSIFELRYPGIAVISVALTSATAIGMLLLYRLEIIRVTETLKSVIFSATAGIAFTYGIVLLMGLFGFNTSSFFESSSLYSVGFSFFVVGIAAFNLLLDFALIEESVENQLPKYMEWYAAFNVLVTLVWLYLEILRLMSKLAKRK